VNRVELLMRPSDDFVAADNAGTAFTLTHSDEPPVGFELPAAPNVGNLLRVVQEASSKPGEWVLAVKSVAENLADDSGKLNPDAVEDIAMIVHYTVA
jgi:hypothetical protein